MSESVKAEFPKFQVFLGHPDPKVGEKEYYLPKDEAGSELAWSMRPSRIGTKVLEATGRTRDMTADEHNAIIDVADRIDENK